MGIGSTGNPYIRLPDGRRMLWSDINDASMAMDLGGVSRGGNRGGAIGGPSIQIVPNATPRPSRGLTGDSSGSGLVNRNLFRQDNQANTDWWTGGRENPNRPHSAMDFDPSQTVSGTGRNLDRGVIGGLNGVPLYSPTPGEIFGTPNLHSYGEPSVEVSGFPDQRWTQGSGNNGGSIWSDDLAADPSSAGMVNPSLFGDDRFTYTETPRESDDLSGLSTYDETTYRPTVDLPESFTLNTYDENEPQYTNAPPDNDNDLSGLHHYAYPGSGNLSNFGGDLSLGGFLNTSLSLMGYGEGYPAVPSGRVLVGGGADFTPSEPGQWVDRPDGSGADWVENARSNPNGAPPLNDGTGTTYIPLGDPNLAMGNDGTGTTIINRDQPSYPTPPGMTIIGHDTQNGAPIYQDAQGNRFVNPGTGTPVPWHSPAYIPPAGLRGAIARGDYTTPYGASAQRTANNMQMYAAQMNPIGAMRAGGWGSGDEIGHNRFYGREQGMWEASDGIAMRVPGVSSGASRSGVRGLSGG